MEELLNGATPRSLSRPANAVLFRCPWYKKMAHPSTQERQAAGSMSWDTHRTDIQAVGASLVPSSHSQPCSRPLIFSLHENGYHTMNSVPQAPASTTFLGPSDVALVETTGDGEGGKLQGCLWVQPFLLVSVAGPSHNTPVVVWALWMMSTLTLTLCVCMRAGYFCDRVPDCELGTCQFIAVHFQICPSAFLTGTEISQTPLLANWGDAEHYR